VIGMAARTLRPAQRKGAIVIGALFAVALRVWATFLVAHLLRVPALSAIGGTLVCWIAMKLLLEDGEAATAHEGVQSFWHAVRLIVVADFVMSADNMLAVGGASGGSFQLVLFGLALSIPLVIFCSSGIASLLERYPRLADVGAGVLGWTGGQMILHDLIQDGGHRGLLTAETLGPWLPLVQWGTKISLTVGVILGARAWACLRQRRRKTAGSFRELRLYREQAYRAILFCPC
jgi:YjbE family integral membrane protein